jgi:hypothetical protein
MTGQELLELLDQAKCRSNLTGTLENGIIAALDMEGRLFAVLNNKVLNRVVPSSVLNKSNKTAYRNPGGDVLWPAPEGTCFGYEYATGNWRVPPEITGAVWEITGQNEKRTVIKAEIDLVNNRQLGIPCEFERHIEVEYNENCLVQNVTEMIRYIGVKTLFIKDFRLAPWSLCQLDTGKGCEVIMPYKTEEDIRDLYSSSLSMRGISNDKYIVNTNTYFRFQLGMGENVPWIEYKYFDNLKVKRYTGTLPPGQKYIDIADAPPDQIPSEKGIKLSIYCDPTGFMEIEACGGCPDILSPGKELSVNIITEYKINTDN